MYYIRDSKGRRTRDSKDEVFCEDTIDDCHRVISYYFDMDYDTRYEIVDWYSDEVVETVEKEVYEDDTP